MVQRPDRLLAFRVPGDFVYCAGSFPLAADGIIRDEMKTIEALAPITRRRPAVARMPA